MASRHEDQSVLFTNFAHSLLVPPAFVTLRLPSPATARIGRGIDGGGNDDDMAVVNDDDNEVAVDVFDAVATATLRLPVPSTPGTIAVLLSDDPSSTSTPMLTTA